MDITLAVVADAANRTESGKLNVLGIFQAIFTSAVPCRHPALALVIGLEASPTEAGQSIPIGITLIDEDGRLLMKFDPSDVAVPLAFQPLRHSTTLIINIGGAYFPRFGTYRFEVTANHSTIGHVPLHVTHVLPT